MIFLHRIIFSLAISCIIASALYAHWESVDASATRNSYSFEVQKENFATSSPAVCVFCNEPCADDDEHYFILKHFKHVYVQLNPFPYRQGHMLVVPYRHVAKLQDLTPEERAELIEVVALAMQYLSDEYHTDGMNTGLNEGRVGGASKPDHLHVQIVPRWVGDTGWFNLIGQTGIITESMHTTYKRLKAKFD